MTPFEMSTIWWSSKFDDFWTKRMDKFKDKYERVIFIYRYINIFVYIYKWNVKYDTTLLQNETENMVGNLWTRCKMKDPLADTFE